jgi:chaperonin cofactor prefoldin
MQLDSSLNTVMTAYERANLDWPFDEHFRVVDTSKDPSIVVALPPTPAMLALAAEKQSTQNYVFDLEREIGELREENERLHSNYATSILQNDEDRLKIDNLNAEIKRMTADKDSLQKKAKSLIEIVTPRTKAAKTIPVVVQLSSTETQTEDIEMAGNELKEFQCNQRLQSVAGLMLRQLESRSEANKNLQQSVEDAATGINISMIEGEYIQHEILQVTKYRVT